MPPLRTLFFGTAELACPSLDALRRFPGANLAAVVTQPDRPKGRHLNPQPSPVKVLAAESNLAVLQPERARDPSFIEVLSSLKPDLVIVAAYGQILPKSILDLPRFGCLNVHASLLPKYRGAAPIQWAILNDEPETGVTIMKMDEGLDTGDIVSQRTAPIDPDDDARTMHDKLARLGATLLIESIPDYVGGRTVPRPQPPAGASYARKIRKEDGLLDWGLPARTVWNRIRAFTPWPGARTRLAGESPTTLNIWRAEIVGSGPAAPGEILSATREGIVVACGQQAVRILELQREGGRRMTAREFLAGHPLAPSQRLEPTLK